MKIRNGCPLVIPSSLEELLGGETSQKRARAHQGAFVSHRGLGQFLFGMGIRGTGEHQKLINTLETASQWLGVMEDIARGGGGEGRAVRDKESTQNMRM